MSKFKFHLKTGRKNNGETVVLVHGLFHRSFMFLSFARYLAERGYVVYSYDYASTRGTVKELGDGLAGYLLSLRREMPPERPVHLVGHSMGGLLIRYAVSTCGNEIHPGRIIMLGTPNHGSPMADYYLKKLEWSPKLVRSLPGLGTQADHPGLPEGVDLGVITADFDNKVPEKSTRLDNCKAYCNFPLGHVGLLFDRRVMEAAERFLRTGLF